MTPTLLILAAIGLLQAADVVTTVKGLALGGADDEANPLGRWLFARFGAVPASIALKLLLTAPIVAFAYFYPAWWPVPAAYAASLVWVVIHNLRVLASIRRDGG